MKRFSFQPATAVPVMAREIDTSWKWLKELSLRWIYISIIGWKGQTNTIMNANVVTNLVLCASSNCSFSRFIDRCVVYYTAQSKLPAIQRRYHSRVRALLGLHWPETIRVSAVFPSILLLSICSDLYWMIDTVSSSLLSLLVWWRESLPRRSINKRKGICSSSSFLFAFQLTYTSG